MPDDTASEIREIKLRIANLLLLAGRTEQRQEVTIGYLKEVQLLRQRLLELRTLRGAMDSKSARQFADED
jgi:hypothetical protein